MTSLAAALVSFVWQGAIIGALAWIGFSLSRSPRTRYAVGIAALALMAVAPVVTGVISHRRSPVQGSTFNVPGSSNIEVSANRSGGEALRQGTQSFGESGTSSARFSWATGQLDDPRWVSLVLAFWVAGVAALSLRLAFGWIGARRLTKRVTAAGADLQALADRLVAKLRIRATVEIVESALVQVPSVIGAFKPVVLLPAAAMSGLSMEQVEALLAHELAHVRRHDYLVNLFQSAIETLLFYHPAVWLVSRRVRQERELCCDDLALDVCGDRVAYASALAELESLRALPSPALAATGGSLLTRIRRILGADDAKNLSTRSKSVAGVAILTAIALVLATQATRASKLQSIEGLAASIAPPGMQIFPAEPMSALAGRAAWSPTPPQEASPQAVQGGVTGGVQGGVKNGVKGGVPNQEPLMIVDTTNNEATRLEIGNELLIWVSTPNEQAEFSKKSYTIDANGNITLPLIGSGRVAGLNVGEARQLIRRRLVELKLFTNPTVDMTVVRGRVIEANSPQAAPGEAKPSYLIKAGDELSVSVASPIVQPEFSRQTYPVQPDGTILLPHLDRPMQVSGLTMRQTAVAIQKALIDAKQYSNPSVDVMVANYTSAQRVETAPAPQQPSGSPIAIGQIIRLEVSVGQVRQSEFNKDYTVQPDGTIYVPYVGAIRVVGLAVVAAQDAITAALTAKGTLPGARVLASIEGRSVPNMVFVTGQVKTPGAMPWKEGLTVQQVVSAVGLTPFADTAKIHLQTIDSEAPFLKLTDAVPAGSVVVVPLLPSLSVTVQGAVRTPGVIILTADRNTITDAIASAGGLQPGAGARVFLHRNGMPDRTFSRTELIQGRVADNKIQDRDTIIVEVAPHFYVTGYVKSSQSEYSWEPGITLQRAIAMAGGPTPEGASMRVNIKRKDPTTGKFIAVKLDKDAMATPIQPDDVISVPKKRM
jgi:protein involved in polysaccharide export with SLBB domain/beta-lactamase regulating signal transducer with metallopeptidase domain